MGLLLGVFMFFGLYEFQTKHDVCKKIDFKAKECKFHKRLEKLGKK